MDLGIGSKLALVTGSTAGIGYAAAEALAREGARVVINGRTPARVESAIAKLRGAVPQATVAGVAADVATAEGCRRLIEAHSEVDILVNNMGVFEARSFDAITDEDWMRFFEANVLSGVRLARHYLRGMRARDWGRIVFVSSESGVQIPAEMIHYGVTKTAQIALARGIAETLTGTNVTVNSVLPGPTASEAVQRFMAQASAETQKDAVTLEREFFELRRPSSILQRFTTTDEVAALIAYVCSSRASATTGAALRVDGGVVRAIV